MPKKFDILKTKTITLTDSEGCSKTFDIGFVEKIESIIDIFRLEGCPPNTNCSHSDVFLEIRSQGAFSCHKKCCH